MLAFGFVIAANVVAFSQTGAPVVTKTEPPSWWAGQTINPVRLLLRGTNLTGARVESSSRSLRISNVRVNANGTYVFVDVSIAPNTRTGPYQLKLTTAGGTTTFPFNIERPLSSLTNFQGISSNDVIYLIMTDRFVNGDPSNDAPAGSPAAANNRKNPRSYHGGDLRGVINHLPYLKQLGVTALWLTPWYDNWNGINECNHPWCPNTYYHGYHAIDYYSVEDHFGDLATLKELVERAHALGLKVIQDQVANHVGSKHPWVTNPPLEDWFHGTLAKHSLNRFRNSVLLSPHGNVEDVRNTLDGWFNDDLPDMNQEEPEVTRYEIQNSLWWIGETGIDAVRQDTIQYMPRTFIRDLSDALHRQYPKMWMVGEVFEEDAAQTAFFIGGHRGWDGIDTKLDSVFDFALWSKSLKVFTAEAPMRELRDELKYDALYPDPLKITTLANNHDTMRFMSRDKATLEGAMMHVAFMLTVRGVPQLYYGEEIAMDGKNDPDNRRDFPGGFPGDDRDAFTASGRRANEERMYEWTHAWLQLRASHSALRVGKLIDLAADDDVYSFARQDKGETIVLAFNRGARKTITVSAGALGAGDGANLVPLFGQIVTARFVNGQASLSLPEHTAVVYRLLR